MKSIKTIVGIGLLMLGAIGFASCSQEEDNAVIQEKSNLLKIRTSVADSRGVITGTTFQQGDEIGICVTTVDGHDYTGNSQNIRAIYTGSDWRLEREVELREDEAIVYAYYPYNANATDSIDINMDPAATPEQTDYLYGYCQGVNLNNSTANIRFNHALARITLAVTKGANDVGEGVVSAAKIVNGYYTLRVHPTGELVRIQGNAISVRGKMSIKTGEIVSIYNSEDYISSYANLVIDESVQNIEFMIIPSVGAFGGICASLTIDGKDYEVSLQTMSRCEAGQQYTYPIIINRNIISGPAKVGDYYYSDGTWSTEYNTSKQCIGIVFALTDTKGSEINPNLIESMHGRIIALQDVAECQWGNVGEDVIGIPNFTEWFNESPAQLHINEYGCISDWPTGGCVTDFNGYENTQYINSSSYPAAYACYTYKTVGTESGEWYLPACGEMELLEKLYYESFISNSRQAVFEDWANGFYWTSTELESNAYYNEYVRAFTVNIMTNSGSHNEKDEKHPVRAAKVF